MQKRAKVFFLYDQYSFKYALVGWFNLSYPKENSFAICAGVTA